MLNNKFFFKLLANSILGMVLIFIWSRFVNFSDLLSILKTVQIKFIFLFFSLFAFSGALRGIRLKLLLGKHKIPFKDIIMLSFLSQFLSFMIPIRAGEITKSVYLTSQFNLPLGKTLTWVFVDRSLDLLLILFLIAVLLPFTPTNLPGSFVNIVLVVLFVFILFFIAAVKNGDLIKKITDFLSNYLIISSIKRWFVSFTHTIIDGFDILHRHPLELIPLIGLTFIALISDSLVWASVFSALGIDLNFCKIILGNGLEAFSFLLPAAPGFIGSAEAAGIIVWGAVLGIEINQASAVIVFFHILTMITLLILGLLAVYFLKFDLRLVWKRLRR